MGYNSVVSSHPKSIRIPRVDGLSTDPRIWGVTDINTIQMTSDGNLLQRKISRLEIEIFFMYLIVGTNFFFFFFIKCLMVT